jgi:uncharacterized protein YndB with AHSA1/START domain
MGAVSTASDGLRLRVRIEAPPDALVRAITEPDLMTEWLAETVEASPDRYEFWGRYVPRGDRARQRLIAADATGVRFAWDLDGAAESQVELAVAADGERGSDVTLTHTGVPSDAGAALAAFWHLALTNLAARGEGFPTTPPLDFTVPAQGEARVRTVVALPPEEVYACLLDPERVERWAGAPATIEPTAGGRYELEWDDGGPVRIADLASDRALTLAWRAPDGAETLVRWDLRTAHGHTYLTLVHGDFDDGLAERARQRWVPRLVELKRMLELGPRWRPLAG